MSSAQYWAPSAWFTAAVQHVVEGAALEAQAALIEAFSSSVLLDLVSHISTYPINRFMLGELAQVLKAGKVSGLWSVWAGDKRKMENEISIKLKEAWCSLKMSCPGSHRYTGPRVDSPMVLQVLGPWFLSHSPVFFVLSPGKAPLKVTPSKGTWQWSSWIRLSFGHLDGAANWTRHHFPYKMECCVEWSQIIIFWYFSHNKWGLLKDLV